ncbi:MAG TPA: hypothetical protein VM557_00735 [Thermoanaerobaculia bacterium]|nr:hypothetical protein [Thermoanaerobaculia bacterium]
MDGFALHVRGSDEAVGVVSRLLEATGLRGFGSQTGDIFSQPAALESMREWRAYRDQVVDENDGKIQRGSAL